MANFLKQLFTDELLPEEQLNYGKVAPIRTYKNIPSQEEDDRLKEIFQQKEKERQEKVLASLFQGNTAGVNGLQARNTVLEQDLAPQLQPRQYDSPRDKFQREEGYSPDTPTAIALDMEKQNKENDYTPVIATAQDEELSGGKLKAGTVTNRGTIKLFAAAKRTSDMADATAGRQLNTFAQQEKMAEEAEKRKPPTESQSKAALFANRVEQSDPVIDELTDYVTTLNPAWFEVQKNTPDIANKLKDPQFKQYDQARRNFLNAILRRESGAVISPTEMVDGNRQYFPLPGDDDKTLEQKRQNRIVAISNLKNEGGKAYKAIYSNPIAVGAALQAKKITEKQAKYILKRDFGFQD